MTPTTTDATRSIPGIRLNARQAKPRTRGLTEIRGPYYTPMGPRYLADVLETMGESIDALKFAGGAFAVMRPEAVRGLIEACHAHDVQVSTGGFIEYVLTQGPEAVERYLEACRGLGFDIVEVSTGFITVPVEDVIRLVRRVQDAGMKAKAEVGIQFGAGGASAVAELEAEGAQDLGWAVERAARLLEAGAYLIMVESEGITESVRRWRTDAPGAFIKALGLERMMFEAADPAVFAWYVTQFGPDVNLFVDHSQIVQLACLRAGIWGTKSLWGRVLTYRPDGATTEA